jgi:hypothetical protein
MTYLFSLQNLIASQRRRMLFLFLLTALGYLTVASLRASEPTIADSLSQSSDRDAQTADASPQPPLIADSWNWFGPVKSALSSRTHMLQFGAVACCIALYIIWWRK